MRKIGFIVFAFLVVIVLVRQLQPGKSSWYRFIVANDQLFALEYADAYGTEQRLYTTQDSGSTWQVVDAPKKICALAGNGEQLVAATSLGEIWYKNADDMPWKMISQSSGNNPYYYCVLLSRSNDIFAVGNDSISWLDTNGKLQHEFPMPSTLSDPEELFVNASFASTEEKNLIVEANPNSVYVIDLENRALHQWMEGVMSAQSKLGGPGRVRRMGNKFLLSHASGIYVSSELLEPWQPLNTEIRQDDYLGGNLCRDLVGYDSVLNQWIVAKDRGIHLMENADEVRTVYTDKPGDHFLVVGLTQHDGNYFVSFSRLQSGCMGIRLSSDLSTWQPIWLEKR
ncbi:MAG: hypothetical protein J3T61_09360 [Candidatus Brocadiales bacterium]|nr:hypothetical protein [Candidatus Bathyanammoxibius sp.]